MNFKPLDGINTGGKIVSAIFEKSYEKYKPADDYLRNLIAQNGAYTKEEELRAAAMLLVPEQHGKLRRLSKMIKKTEEMYTQIFGVDDLNNRNIDINEDWMAYYLDRASLIADESVQKLWSAILMQECHDSGSFRKVMLDRLALLDRKSAEAFAALCRLSYEIVLSNGSIYSIPFYIRNDILDKMQENRKFNFTKEMVTQYQQIRPDETELEILQEIGLIQLSEPADESDLYDTSKFNATVFIKDEMLFSPEPQFDENNDYYYLVTGQATYTSSGLTLYNAIAPLYNVSDVLANVLNAFFIIES